VKRGYHGDIQREQVQSVIAYRDWGTSINPSKEPEAVELRGRDEHTEAFASLTQRQLIGQVVTSCESLLLRMADTIEGSADITDVFNIRRMLLVATMRKAVDSSKAITLLSEDVSYYESINVLVRCLVESTVNGADGREGKQHDSLCTNRGIPETLARRIASPCRTYPTPAVEGAILRAGQTKFYRKGEVSPRFTQAAWAFTERVLRENRAYAQSAIRHALFGATKDCAVDVEDVFGELHIVTFRFAPVLAKQGTAKLASRVYRLAQRHTLSYHTRNRNLRHAAVEKHLRLGGTIHCEFLSDAELAAMRAAETEDRAAA